MDIGFSEATSKLFKSTSELDKRTKNWEEELMYESPIRMIMTEMQTQMEKDCISAVQGYGFNVDAEELKKALAYDRNQYEKGFKDAGTVPVVIHNMVFGAAMSACPTDVTGYLDKSRNLIFVNPAIAVEFIEQQGGVIEEIKEPFGGMNT